MLNHDGVLFDFDGVLVDSEPVHFTCWQEILEPFGIRLDWDTYVRHGIGISDRQMLTFLAHLKNPPADVEELAAQYPRKKELFRKRMLENTPVSDELRNLLGELHGRYRLAVVSSSNITEVEPVLVAGQIRDLFQTVVSGDQVPRLKPAPDPYWIAAERLDVSRPLVVEDSDAGVASGQAAGFEVLRVPEQAQMIDLVRRRLGIPV
ncbi:MAG TPA: HAD family phosphatase [Bryobacteraceae bacterium]|jgi:beta-phosphoglucomutase|nr:HAD family phosphatase [Bryobacteraceae bacterium]